MTTAGYLVDGMTCGYCMGKVHEKVRSLSGVTKVAMDLVAGGQSPLLVMSGNRLGVDAVRGAVESAGFGLLPRSAAEVHPRGDGPSAQEADTHPDRQQQMRVSVGGVGS
jgi:copper chaperone